MQTYTVKSVMPTGKPAHETYGTEYHVQFNEDPRPVKLSRKKMPQVDDQMEGEITDGKYGAMFKKAPFNPQGFPSSTTSQTTTSTATQSGTPRQPAYNNDGVRQGMCINNAANYVNILHAEKPLDDIEWAEKVHSYAKALYLAGGLDEDLETTSADVPSTVADIFGPGAVSA